MADLERQLSLAPIPIPKVPGDYTQRSSRRPRRRCPRRGRRWEPAVNNHQRKCLLTTQCNGGRL